jgi:putative serine protease PepD
MGSRLSAIGMAMAAGLASAATLASCSSSTSHTASGTAGGGSAQSISGPANELQQQYQDVVKAVLPSVVEINTSNATGSGVVYDDKGDIVTNAHVVGDAHTVQVLASGGATGLQATVIGTFTPDDLAVIRVASDASSLHPAKFGPSSAVATGQIVMAMGSPLGLNGTVTQGIISATDRTVTESATAAGGTPTTLADALQTSAAINSGNSGGALVDLAGQVIGIPTAAAQNPSSGSQAAGIGFAIPSNTVTNIADQLIDTGKVTSSSRAALGITGKNYVSPSGQPGGVTVVSVTSGEAASKAGLKPGDVITAINNEQIPNQAALSAVLANLKPGQTVPLEYVRNGSLATTTLTLGQLTG